MDQAWGGATDVLDIGAGHRQEEVYDIGTDSQQNIYMLSAVGKHGLDIDGQPKENFGDPITLTDYALVSFSCDGTYRWSKIIGGKSRENAPYLEIGSDDNIYVPGKFSSCDGEGPNEYPARIDDDIIINQSSTSCSVLFLAQYSPDGELLWFKQPQEYGNQTDVLSNTSSKEMLSDDNGNLYWLLAIPSGTYADGAFTNTMDGTNYFIFKYNTEGAFIEALPLDMQLYGSVGLNLQFYRNPHNDHFYFTSKIAEDDTAVINGQPVEHSFFLASFDEEGNFLWERENTATLFASMYAYNIVFDSSNNIYMGGVFIGFGIDSFLGFSIAEEINPNFVMKTDPTAENLLWVTHNTQPSDGGGDFIINEVLGGNEVILTGNAGADYTWGDQTIHINAPGEYKDVTIARFDTDTGDCIALDYISGDPGYPDRGTAIAVDSSGDYLIGGGFGHNLYDVNGNEVYNGGSQSDFFIAKYATQPCNEPVASTENQVRELLTAYPNPARERVRISTHQELTYVVYTLAGKVVKTGRLTAENREIGLQGLSEGLYMVQLTNQKGEKSIVKVLKQK